MPAARKKVEVLDLDETTEEDSSVEEEEVPEVEEEEEIVDVLDDEPADDEELWEGGPTFGDVKAWKEEYGDENIFLSVINATLNKFCIWRTLDRHEYRQLVKKLEQAIQSGQVSETEATMNNEEDIAQLCVLFPPYDKNNRKGTNAGFPKLIANDVMEQSGFVEVEVRQL